MKVRPFMRILVLSLLLVLGGAVVTHAQPAGYAPTVLADPKPSFDHPRKIVMSLSESDPVRVNEVLSNAGNIQKFYGADYVQIALVAYGPGIHAVLRSDSKVQARIRSLQAIGIEVLACGATLEALHKTPADVLKGVPTVANGLPEIVERQLRGWVYVRP